MRHLSAITYSPGMTPEWSACAQKSAAAVAERGTADVGGGPAAAERHYLNVAAECAIVGGSARSTLNFLAALDMAPQRSLSTASRLGDGSPPAASPPQQQADGADGPDLRPPASSAAEADEDADGSHEMPPRRAISSLHVTLPDEAQSPAGIPPAFDMATLLHGSGHSSVFELGLGLEPSPQTVAAH